MKTKNFNISKNKLKRIRNKFKITLYLMFMLLFSINSCTEENNAIGETLPTGIKISIKKNKTAEAQVGSSSLDLISVFDVVVTPDNAKNKTFFWSLKSDADKTKADLTLDGKLTTKKDGEITLVVTSNAKKDVTAEAKFTIKAPVLLKTLKLVVKKGQKAEVDTNTSKLDLNTIFDVTFTPTNATNKTLSWSLKTDADKTIASLTTDGKLSPKKEGKITLVVTSNVDTKIKAEMSFTIKALVLPTSVDLVIKKGKNPTVGVDALQLDLNTIFDVKIIPSNAKDKTVSWSLKSDADKTKASLTTDGKLSPKKEGGITLVITSNANTKLTAEKTFVITSPVLPTAIKIATKENKTPEISTETSKLDLATVFNITFTPDNTTDKSVLWTLKSNEDKTKADLTADGKLKPKKEGQITLVITANADKKVTTETTFTIKAPILPNSIQSSLKQGKKPEIGLNDSQLDLTTIFNIQISPKDTEDKTISWSIRDTDKANADVTTDGKLTPKKEGSIILVVISNADTKITTEINFKIKGFIRIQGDSSAHLGDTKTFTAQSSNGAKADVNWSIQNNTNNKYGTINETGKYLAPKVWKETLSDKPITFNIEATDKTDATTKETKEITIRTDSFPNELSITDNEDDRLAYSSYTANNLDIDIYLGVTSIGASSFSTPMLTAVTIPKSVKTLGNRSFIGSQITDLIIPTSVESVGIGSFDGNSELTSVTLSNTLWNKIISDTNSDIETVFDGNVESYKDFQGNELVASIVISSEETTLEDDQSITLTSVTKPAGKDVTWSIDNSNIASIDDKGVLTGKRNGPGLVKVTAKVGDVVSDEVTITLTRGKRIYPKAIRDVINPIIGSDAPTEIKTIYVSTTGGSSIKDGSSWSKAYEGSKLNAAINEAGSLANQQNPYLVLIAPGTYSIPSTLNMKNNVTIAGGINNDDSLSENPTILDGNDSVTVFNAIYVNNLILFGVTITKSKNRNGGGIYTRTSSLNLIRVIFSENNATYRGGGVYISNRCNVKMTQVTFSNNSSIDHGGVIYNESSTISLNQATFSGNSAGGSGGVIYNESNIAIDQASFSGNSAGGSGGVIYDSSGGSTSITRSSFSNNSAGEGGGGLYIYIVSSSKSFSQLTFFGNTASKSGGGMSVGGNGNLRFEQMSFYNNTAPQGRDMDISVFGNNTLVTFVNSIFWNTAGPSVYVKNTGSSVKNINIHNTVLNGIEYTTPAGEDGVVPNTNIISSGLIDTNPNLLMTPVSLYPGGASISIPIIQASSSAVNKGLYIRKNGGDYYYSEDNTKWYSSLTNSGPTNQTTLPASASNLTEKDITDTNRSGRPDIGAYEAR